jgi:predicted metal-dependent hydrolase
MADQHYKIHDQQGKRISVILRRDKRLTKTIRWERMADGSLLLRVPSRMPKRHIGGLLKQVAGQLDKQIEIHAQRNDEILAERANMINRRYFNGELQWNAIRWVGNMSSRLGSCTHGGHTDGQIRISDKIKDWPDWVVDYVIAHELLHRKYPNHSTAFKNNLKAAYPLTERAFGFIEGVNFATGKAMGDDDMVDSPDEAQNDPTHKDHLTGT